VGTPDAVGRVGKIKHTGAIAFTDARPKDYGAELGYNWHAGH
jgi:hypothetical protein